jgi:hypothetical protein
MSNTNKTNFTCRDKYFNYGSYLRSRGYDKEFCNLVNDIQSGNIPIGPIIPGSCPSTTTTINNNVTINECPTLANSGILNITGGDIGLSTTTTDNLSTLLIKSNNFSLQSNKGIKNLGPIIQVTDCSHINYFGAGGHVFAGGIGDCSANVVIKGDLTVDNFASIYDLSVVNVLTIGTGTTYIDTSNVNTTNVNAENISSTIEISGNHLQINDISCVGNIEITGSGVFIGDISSSQFVDLSNAVSSNTQDILDLSGTISNYDISFSTTDLSTTNLNVSGDISFTKNPIITNTVDTIPRSLSSFGETMTVIDTSSNTTYLVGQHEISFNNIIYSNVDNSANIFANSIIDFSNNQSYFKNSILEVYYSVPANFSNPADAFTVSFKEVGGSQELFLDTRSVGNGLGERTIVFGPQTFVFTPSSPDISYIGKQWNLNYDISGGPITTSNGRLTIKQKSLI